MEALMRELLRRLEVTVAWHLLAVCHWGERLLWERYDHDFIADFIMPDLEIETPPEPMDDMDTSVIDEIPF